MQFQTVCPKKSTGRKRAKKDSIMIEQDVVDILVVEAHAEIAPPDTNARVAQVLQNHVRLARCILSCIGNMEAPVISSRLLAG